MSTIHVVVFVISNPDPRLQTAAYRLKAQGLWRGAWEGHPRPELCDRTSLILPRSPFLGSSFRLLTSKGRCVWLDPNPPGTGLQWSIQGRFIPSALPMIPATVRGCGAGSRAQAGLLPAPLPSGPRKSADETENARIGSRAACWGLACERARRVVGADAQPAGPPGSGPTSARAGARARWITPASPRTCT